MRKFRAPTNHPTDDLSPTPHEAGAKGWHMSKFDDAVRFATEAHAGMMRKRGNTPYILHPMEVATIAATLTEDEDVLCAAMLHDVVEDTPHSLEELEQAFGARVRALVATETENKRPDVPAAESWLIRKQESIAELRASADQAVLILWLSDKLANMRSFARLHEREGDAMWQAFNQSDPALQAWYYREVAQATSSLADTRAWREFTHLLSTVFGELM